MHVIVCILGWDCMPCGVLPPTGCRGSCSPMSQLSALPWLQEGKALLRQRAASCIWLHFVFAQPGILQCRTIYSSLSHPSWVWNWEQPHGAGAETHKGLAGLWSWCCKPQQPHIPVGQHSRAPAPSCFSARSQPVHTDPSVVTSSSCPVVPLGVTWSVPFQGQSCQLLYVRLVGRCPDGTEQGWLLPCLLQHTHRICLFLAQLGV